MQTTFKIAYCLASSLALGLVSTAAGAETFTFTGTYQLVNTVAVDLGLPAPVSDIFSKGESVLTFASGKKVNATTSCGAWDVPSGGTLTRRTICTGLEDNGDKFALDSDCRFDTQKHIAECTGWLRGTAGRYMGKTGSISWHIDTNARTNAGVGMWNE